MAPTDQRKAPIVPCASRSETARPVRQVLLVGNFLSRSSSTYRSVCEDLAARLEGSGWSVTTTSDRRARWARLPDMVATTWRRRHDYSAAQVDVFSGPSFLWAEAVCWTLHRAGRRYALTLRGGDLPRFARRWPARVRRLLASADAVTTPSRYLLEEMRSYRDDICLLPNPLDLSAYSFRPRRLPRPHLIWLRAFHEIYNPSLAPRVLAQLGAEFPEARLTMVGPDKGDGSLRRVARVAEELGVSDRLTLIGGIPKVEVPTRLGEGDIFLNTTNVDNTPVSVLEAMACGLCVVSTNVGGLPYLLNHEKDALLVPPDDPEAMAAGVGRLLVEPGLAEGLSHAARAAAEACDWSVVLPQWESLLSTLIMH